MERCTERSTEDTKKDSKTLLTLHKSTLPLRSSNYDDHRLRGGCQERGVVVRGTARARLAFL